MPTQARATRCATPAIDGGAATTSRQASGRRSDERPPLQQSIRCLPAVGAILAIALIAAPAAAVRIVAPSFRAMLVVAPLVGAASGVLGVLASRAFAIAAGPAIALIATGIFGLALLAGRLRRVPLTGRIPEVRGT